MPAIVTIMKETVATELIRTMGGIITLVISTWLAYRLHQMDKTQKEMKSDQKEIKSNVNGNMQRLIEKVEPKKPDTDSSVNGVE